LWTDDNLSNDYYFRYLAEADRERVAAFRLHGRVCCFKGYSPTSFAFNTRALPELFNEQFALFDRLRREGLDLYAYVTLTSPSAVDVADEMPRFLDRLQAISPQLPLRTVPLQIQVFKTVSRRVGALEELAITNQERARDAWLLELERRYPAAERERASADISSVCL
jgi:hypothetical protein